MRCPVCASLDDKVVDSRLTDDGGAIRRRRECLSCGRRFTTFEREDVAFLVIKRSGEREPFERAKIVAGLHAAAKNRPLSDEMIEDLASHIEEDARLTGPEVTSEHIGQAVLGRLKVLDDVAYLRFASVHKDFAGAADFAREADLLDRDEPHQGPPEASPDEHPEGH